MKEERVPPPLSALVCAMRHICAAYRSGTLHSSRKITSCTRFIMLLHYAHDTRMLRCMHAHSNAQAQRSPLPLAFPRHQVSACCAQLPRMHRALAYRSRVISSSDDMAGIAEEKRAA